MTKEAPVTNDDVARPRTEETRTAKNRVYDLEERTARFAEAIIDFAKGLPRDPITLPLIGQLVRTGSSIGADYCEADDAVSRKGFPHRISVCKKEARESKYWLRVIAKAAPAARWQARALWREARELHLIFASIWPKNLS